MKIKPRRMKKYAPRRRRYSKQLQKQQLKDFEHLLYMDLSSYLILKEEGTLKQVQQAQEKMRSDLLKYGSDMQEIATDLKADYPNLVQEFIRNLMLIVQDSSETIDPAMINRQRKLMEKLKAGI